MLTLLSCSPAIAAASPPTSARACAAPGAETFTAFDFGPVRTAFANDVKLLCEDLSPGADTLVGFVAGTFLIEVAYVWNDDDASFAPTAAAAVAPLSREVLPALPVSSPARSRCTSTCLASAPLVLPVAAASAP